jgi:ribose transport system ATP-binding protein
MSAASSLWGDDVPETLKIERLSKSFPGQAALIEVDLEIGVGEVHALVGQNGSGKSTLIKVLAGYHQPDPGSSAWVSGEPLVLGDGHAAAAAGIRFVHQDLGLVGSISTIENLALTTGYRTGRTRRILWKREQSFARDAMNVLGLDDVDVKAPVATLSAAQKTGVAIARALVGWQTGTSLLVLDEPTATLPGQDVTRLFEVIRRLRSTGISILYVSHHLDEVFALADRVTVLRDARRVATVPVSRVDHGGLIELIVGHRIEETTASATTRSGSPLLRVVGLAGGNVENLDLDVHPGEIVGLAGITGSGREHALGLISGQIRKIDGEVHVGQRPLADHDPGDALAAGLAFVTSDRAVRGIVGPMSVRENLTLCDVTPYVVAGRLRKPPERRDTRSWIDRLTIRTSSSEALIGSLSGGNQQKVMFSKALRLTPKVLLLDEPTQGIDVGAKDQIHGLVDEAARGGVAVVVASTDTDELVRLCHRIVVLVEGRAVAELHGSRITAETIEHIQLQTSQRMS